ncbi:hypothetical protein QFC19_002740 [Naganishia cerealis]|uniref:Uncharacterized protein n=1 Tax=Naganishia cerealis TaxID=610337 RepID=A0ACC2W9F6_9TREE|nr:hypothetical protein QFC19_002740 [Naganishia cerealis]
MGHQRSETTAAAGLYDDMNDYADRDDDSGKGGLGTGGYRRARAGTMPSEYNSNHRRDGSDVVNGLAAENLMPSQAMRSSAGTLLDSLLGPAQGGNTVSVSDQGGMYPSSASSATGAYPLRPHLRHTASSAAALTGGTGMMASASADSSHANRHRSGSLTLGDNAVGTASNNTGTGFGSVFYSGTGRSQLNQVMGSKELRMTTSHTSSNGSSGGVDDYVTFSTMDYLGLADNSETPRATTFGFERGPTMPSARDNHHSQADNQATPSQSNVASAIRNRASTVSNFARPAYKSASSFQDLISAGNPGEDRDSSRPPGLYDDYSRYNLLPDMTTSGLDGYGQNNLGSGSADLRGFKDAALLNSLSSSANRPRATTIGILDAPNLRGTASAGALAHPANKLGSSIDISGYGDGYDSNTSGRFIPTTRNDKGFASMHQSLAPRHNASQSISSNYSVGSGALGEEGSGRLAPSRNQTVNNTSGENQGQQPTRSLWLGNLDVMTSTNDLVAVFAEYGTIESLRLLPEKSCAFVNYIDKESAIRAKDDVLIRHGGQIPSLSDTPIRVGFGKIDSVPTAAPSASTLKYSMSQTSLSSMASDTSEARERKTETTPSRALWIGSIPQETTPSTLLSIFSPFGAVESARVLTNKQCGFINFENMESAIAARTALNGREILGERVGAIKIGFAKVPTRSTASSVAGDDSVSGEDRRSMVDGQVFSALKQVKGSGANAINAENLSNVENYGSNLVIDLIQRGVHGSVKAVTDKSDTAALAQNVKEQLEAEGGISEQQMIMLVLSAGDRHLVEDVRAVGNTEKHALYYSYIPASPDRPQLRRFDPSGLKQIRQRLEANFCSPEEIDQITSDMLEDCVVLASDYLGNTIIQKLYAGASPNLRLAMLERIAPHLALIGTNKHGTWAAQAIIERASSPEEMAIIARNLAPYVPPLSADGYGNYLVSACLKFPSPFNNFIFDAMVDRVWDIAQTRFGARCMRTCLEKKETSHFHKKRIATAIILHSVPLATNSNGALLLTWLMDAPELPGRFGLLASRLSGHLSHLATHKLASLTTLRIVNQKEEPEAVKVVLDAIFKSPGDQVLHEILQDQVHGSHTISKIVCGDVVGPEQKAELIQICKRVLESMKNTNGYAYRKLLEVCGLPIPTSAAPPLQGQNTRFGGRSSPGGRGGHAGISRFNNGSGYNQSIGNGMYNNSGMMPPSPMMGGPPHMNPAPGSSNEVNSLISSIQAFQLGQGMVNSGGLNPIMMSSGSMGGMQASFGQALSPNIPQNMSPTPTIGSFATPHASFMSPSSDPFNPFSSPVQLSRGTANQMRFTSPNRNDAPAFELSPSFGGLGMQSAQMSDMGNTMPSHYMGAQQPPSGGMRLINAVGATQ